jgi:cell division septation protein DedD
MYEGTRDAPPALRTWFYPGDVVGQEFLYPHEQAVRISARAKIAVPEVETAQAESTKESAEVVTATAESAPKTESREETVLIAKAEPSPAPEPAPAPIAAPEPQQPAAESQPATGAEVSVAKSESQPDSLPHTAGNGPLAALIGGFSLLLALGVRKMRRSSL